MSVKVSFIIIAFNSEKVIDKSLTCLQKQTFPHNQIEVILVDGLSSDGTKKIMLDYKQNDSSFSRVVVKDNPKKYLACGWNVALKEATGEIILRVDAHTEFPSDFISKNVECIESGQDICGGKVLSILEDDSSLNRAILESENSMFGGGFSFFRRGEVARYTNTLAFAAYKKSVFDRVGYYNENLVRTEDNEMHFRMQELGYKFYFNPSIISYRYCRSSFFKLLKQKFLNGYWVGLTMVVCPRAFSIFYLVPLLFVLGILFLSLLAVVTPLPLIVMFICYAFVLCASLISAIFKDGFYLAILTLPFSLFLLHLVYGLGTLKGFLYAPFWLRKIKH